MMTVVAPIDQPPVFAVGVYLPPPPLQSCLYTLAFGDPGIGVQAAPLPAHSWLTFASSTWLAPAALSGATFPQAGVPCGCTNVAMAGSLLACSCFPSPNVVAFDTVSSTVRRAVTSDAALLQGDPVNPPVKDGFLLSRNEANVFGFDVLHSDMSTSPLLWNAPHNILSVAVDRTMGSIAWVVVDGAGPYSNASLWTSPYMPSTPGPSVHAGRSAPKLLRFTPLTS